MAVAQRSRQRTTQRTTVFSGPWKGVRNTLEPFDEPPDFLQDAQNGYLPDPANGCAFYGRLGFGLLNGRSRVYGVGSFSGQVVYAHTDLSKTTYNFVAFGGHIFRVNNTFTVFTDVTPAVTIDGAATTKIKMLSLGNSLIVSDGVNKPWIASNLASTPITGTTIQYNAADNPWAATDMTEYGGSVFFALNNVNGVSRQFDLAWCEPGQPTLGYEQTNFSNFWSLTQTSNDPITAVHGTNVALFVFRRTSIAKIVGSVGPNLASSATLDAVARNVGVASPRSIFQFGDTIYFADLFGRPMSIDVYGQPIELWQQLRDHSDSALADGANASNAAAGVCVGFDAVHNLVLMTDPVRYPPVNVFGAASKVYMGAWGLISANIWNVEAMGTLLDANGSKRLVILGPSDSDPHSGYVWLQRSANDVLAYSDDSTTNAPFFPQFSVNAQASTGRMGESLNNIFHADVLTAMASGTNDGGTNVEVEIQGTGATYALAPIGGVNSQFDPSPIDRMSRYAAGIEFVGRGVQALVTVNTAGGGVQPSLHQVSVTGVFHKAGVDEG